MKPARVRHTVIGRLGLLAVVTALFCACGAGTAAAQSRPWLGVGGGLGWATADWNATADTLAGNAVYLRGGWAVGDHVRIGGEVDLWRRPVDNGKPESAYRLYNLAGVLSLHARSGLFARGGVGMGVVAGDVDLYKGAMLDASKGPGVLVGVGFESALSAHTAVTFGVSAWAARIGDLRSGQTVLRTEWSQRVVDVTVGLTVK